MQERFFNFVLDYKYLVILLCLLITAALGNDKPLLVCGNGG